MLTIIEIACNSKLNFSNKLIAASNFHRIHSREWLNFGDKTAVHCEVPINSILYNGNKYNTVIKWNRYSRSISKCVLES